MSAAEYPPNAKYYQYYHGLMNLTTVSGLPTSLSLPNFIRVDERLTQNVTIIDNIFPPYRNITRVVEMEHDLTRYDINDKFSVHRYAPYFRVEPFLGLTVYAGFSGQINMHYGPTSLFYPNVRPSIAPLYWNSMKRKKKRERKKV